MKIDKFLLFLDRLRIKKIPMKIRIDLWNIFLRLAILFGCETLKLNNINIIDIEKLYNKSLRKTLSIGSKQNLTWAATRSSILPFEDEIMSEAG